MVRIKQSTPKQDGYQMPGEFEEHSGTWLLWPERPDNWREGGRPAQKAFTEVVKAISEFEPVTVGVNQRQFANALSMVGEYAKVVEMSNDDSWVRDCGPTFVKNAAGDVRGVNWGFNAWGGLVDGLYFPWDKDAQVGEKISIIEGRDYYKVPEFIQEGGAIHSDGDGTIMVTEECLLSEGRNPSMSKEEIEKYLCDYMGGDKVLWVPRGIYNDETNGHIDNICCFVKPGVVLLAWTDNQDDPQYEISQEAFDYLSSVTDAKGRSLEIHKLHVPSPVLITKEESEGVEAIDGTLPRLEGDRLSASYVNFYIVNGGIIMPLFDDAKDAEARDKLQELFPDRKIVGVPAREIILGGGNVHCITQQVPKY